jgi:Cu-Zn family superoxide dismutase
MRTSLSAIVCLAIMSGSSFAQSPKTVRGSFIDGKGQTLGSVTLTEVSKGVLVEAEVSGLPAGQLAFHFHATGKCEPNARFESAGGHFSPQGQKHGYYVEGGPHAGDMPNQFVSQDGKLRTQVINANVTLGEGAASLLDQDGSALIIHAKADDYRTQPSGDAGERVACAVIAK